MRSWLLALAACASHQAAAPRAALAIRDVRMFDGTRVLEHQTVLVARGKIADVGAADVLADARAAKEIDGRGKTLLPGLIDSHAHVVAATDARDALAFGVTTEVDMMSDPAVSVPLAQPAHDRALVLPAGFAATAPGGHGTEYGMEVPTLAKPDEASAFVDARITEGSHHLKIIIEDGSAFHYPTPTVDAPTVKALVEAAHRHHVLAVAHVGSANDVATALAGGVDALVHVPAAPLAAATLDTIAARHMFVVPTLTVLASACGKHAGVQLAADPRIAAKLGAEQRANLATELGFSLDGDACSAPAKTVAKLRARHVPILAGTDAPNPGTVHGASVHDELAALVAAGLSPTEALAAATSVPAHAFAIAGAGEIRRGATADLFLVAGDPTHDITATRAIVKVWRAGR